MLPDRKRKRSFFYAYFFMSMAQMAVVILPFFYQYHEFSSIQCARSASISTTAVAPDGHPSAPLQWKQQSHRKLLLDKRYDLKLFYCFFVSFFTLPQTVTSPPPGSYVAPSHVGTTPMAYCLRGPPHAPHM